ncbi:MAG: DUF29 domain-containing protein [Microcystis aeruginosa K13-05]|nr:DUF29 domain-containing protein [Microcystis aeruginosa K13-05]
MMNITRPNLYDSDYQLWLENTINQLRCGDFQAVDWQNLLEELADLGKNNRRALESLLTRLLEHLLKLTYWQSQRDYNQAAWKGEIRTFRKQIKKLLRDSPSLKPYLSEILEECYSDAREIIIDITQLDASIFPLEVLANLEEILDENWLPNWEAISKDSLYDSDYQLWLENTINQLRRGDFQAVDWQNLLEELADLGKNNRRALKSLLTRLLEHLLKLTYWQSQRDYNQAAWKKEIRNFRLQIADLLEDSPSLKSYLREILAKCYLDARNLMIDETRLDASIFPVEVLASLEEILAENWLPDWEDINSDKSSQAN